MFEFGAGTLWGFPVGGNTAANPTPMKFGTLQDVSLDISGDVKQLYGQKQFPEAVARGKCKITGKSKFAAINGKMLNDLFFGQTMPVSWLVSLDAIISTATVGAALAFWTIYARYRKEPDEIVKLSIGAVIAAGGPLLLALASANVAATGGKVSLLWGLGFHIVNDVGFAMVFPVGLALYSRAAPRHAASAACSSASTICTCSSAISRPVRSPASSRR
jgi:hypothetical protein